LCDQEVIPYGSEEIEKHLTHVVDTMLEYIIPKLGKGEVIMCGDATAKRILGRKLEDRLKREVSYE
jgi:hypothetical protein